MAKLTIAQLRKAGACAEELKRLKAIFGSSVEITEELCMTHASDCNWDWARRLLSEAGSAEYNRVRASAQAEYNRVSASAWVEYDRVKTSALAEYDRVGGPAWAECDRVCASAQAEYRRVRASAWAKVWLAENCG